MSRDVRSPSVAACCGALLGLGAGIIRPRRADARFLASLRNAGLPKATATVSVSPLRQVPRSVPTALIVEGRRRPRRIENSLASFVVTHPTATFVVDPGVCVNVGERAVAQLPAVLRAAVKPSADVVPTAAALAEQGYAMADIDFALPTHAHWDHVCGLLDLPGLPVYLHRTEHDWVTTGSVVPVGGVRDSLEERPTIDYDLDGPPVLTFARSHDLFGDGSVVVVDLAGHTPGSVGVRVLVIPHVATDPVGLADEDRVEAFQTLLRLHVVKYHVRVVPTHDPSAARRLWSSANPISLVP